MAEVDPIITRDFSSIVPAISNAQDIKNQELIISPESSLDVKLTVRGRRSILKDIEKEDLYLAGYVKNPHAGKNVVEITAQVPSGVTATIIPDKLVVEMEELSVQKKNIEIIIDKSAEAGVVVSDMQIDPEYTFIEGPKSLVSKVVRVVCKVDIKDKKSNFSSKYSLVPVDSQGKEVEHVQLSNKTAYVSLGIKAEKKVPVEIVTRGEAPDSYKIKSLKAQPEFVIISGDSGDIDKIQKISTKPISISDAYLDKNIEVELMLPENVSSDVQKIKVEIDVSKVIVENLYISKERISFLNNIQNLDISKNNIPEKVKVKVLYLEEYKKNFKQEDIKLSIDLQDYNPKLAKAEIKASAPEGVEILEIEPKNAILGSELTFRNPDIAFFSFSIYHVSISKNQQSNSHGF
ncbi:hypothetical protein EAL2_c18450 [Peptoclostridium acidaminophilum DSM 3953]|uniref:YbbR family protein n=2 Tax=Peptoclostridium acidaminophilum TaxID=1731 RepID=W8TLU7_PEPAC|nr:hypothetical protein EAL2_c18450 [Peptoclostridium acidaminophilum DSM 3953]